MRWIVWIRGSTSLLIVVATVLCATHHLPAQAKETQSYFDDAATYLQNGNLKAVKTVKLEWKFTEDDKPAQFVEVAGSETEIPCELALLAMGFVHPQHEGLLNELDVELDERGNVKASEKSYQTNISKIFTAGDMRRGQSLVVWAISEGREWARKVDEHLMGHSLLETKDQGLIAV